MTGTALFEVVVPSVGRQSLRTLIESLGAQDVPVPGRVLVVDDRADASTALPISTRLGGRLEVLRGPARGPAAARNVGWRTATAPWVAFVDDDVEIPRWWSRDLLADLTAVAPNVGASQGRLRVPLPTDRRPTDWERHVHGLEDAAWATADMAYRRDVLRLVGGFDERFRHAYREDADLGLRVRGAGYEIVRGRREVRHPVRPADPWVSVRLQAGNADDVLMTALHGRGWPETAQAPRGRRPRHLATAAAGAVGLAGVLAGAPVAAIAGLAGWAAGTAELAWARIAPGPRTAREIATMLGTSIVLPWAATYHWARGLAVARRLRECPPVAGPTGSRKLSRA